MTKSTMKLVLWGVVLFCISANAATRDSWSWWYFPEVAVGGPTGFSYTSTLTIRDLEGLPSRSVYVYFYKDDGTGLPVNVAGVGNQITQFNFTLGPKQERTFILTGTSTIAAGAVEIASYGIGDIYGSLRYTVTDASGNVSDVVAVLPATPAYSWSTTVHKAGTGDVTGFAVQNPYNEDLPISIDFYQNGTRVPGSATYTTTLPPYGHLSKFLHEIFGDSVWKNFSGSGTMRISSTVDTFTAMAVRGDGAQYSSLPMEPDAQQWTCTYTDPDYGATTVNWNWRFVNGWDFVGNEENPNNEKSTVMMRGQMVSSFKTLYVYWTWYSPSNTNFSNGQIIFLGSVQADGSITGNRMALKQDGTVYSNVSFTATRTY